MLKRLLRFLLVFIIGLVVLAAATPVMAEDASWQSDPPKQGVSDFMLCTGEASSGGHSYRNTNYIPNEILGNCDRYAREDTARWFLHRHGITIDPASVTVTVSKP